LLHLEIEKDLLGSCHIATCTMHDAEGNLEKARNKLAQGGCASGKYLQGCADQRKCTREFVLRHGSQRLKQSKHPLRLFPCIRYILILLLYLLFHALEGLLCILWHVLTKWTHPWHYNRELRRCGNQSWWELLEPAMQLFKASL